MANTKITTNVIADDAVTSDKLGGDLTMPGHVSLADNKELRVGTGNDLVIKHSGTHTTLTNTTGNLTLAGDAVYIANAANNEYLAQFIANGAASLRYDNTEQLATVSGGVYIPNELGIGTNSPGTLLHLYNSSNAQMTFQNSTTGTTIGSDGYDITLQGSDIYHILRDSGNQRFYTAGTERMVIDSAGKVGIGTASPGSNLHVKGTGETQVYIDAAASNNPGIRLLENGTNKWTIGNDQSNDKLFFYTFTTSATAMTIDSSQNVVIGASLSATTLTARNGVLELDDNGSHNGVINVPASLFLNIDSDGNSSGEVFDIAKDRTATSGGTSLLKVRENGNVEVPDGNLSFASGHGIDFGLTGNSSGNLGTELFNDYEHGTWTPNLIAGTTNPTGGGYAALNGRYTKIGDRVWVTFYVGRSWTNTPAGAIYVSGLPYTINASTNNWYSAGVVAYNVDGSDSLFILPNVNSTTLQLYASSNNSSWAAVNWSTHTNGTIIYVSASYHYHV